MSQMIFYIVEVIDTAKITKKDDGQNSTEMNNSSVDVTDENIKNKTRFQKYNIRLEDIIKFREKLSEIEIKELVGALLFTQYSYVG